MNSKSPSDFEFELMGAYDDENCGDCKYPCDQTGVCRYETN